MTPTRWCRKKWSILGHFCARCFMLATGRNWSRPNFGQWPVQVILPWIICSIMTFGNNKWKIPSKSINIWTLVWNLVIISKMNGENQPILLKIWIECFIKLFFWLIFKSLFFCKLPKKYYLNHIDDVFWIKGTDFQFNDYYRSELEIDLA